jgi:hypothetical protein
LFDRIPLNSLVAFGASTHTFGDYFKGFEKIGAVRDIFGEETEQILRNIKVDISWLAGYMFVNNANGHIVISGNYLRNGDRIDIYLDIIHELVHIKQFLQGKELFDDNYDYVNRPTEIEAYRHTVQEARRIGLDDERICRYLKTEWITNEDLKRLADVVNVSCK